MSGLGSKLVLTGHKCRARVESFKKVLDDGLIILYNSESKSGWNCGHNYTQRGFPALSGAYRRVYSVDRLDKGSKSSCLSISLHANSSLGLQIHCVLCKARQLTARS